MYCYSFEEPGSVQGCQTFYFQTKISQFGSILEGHSMEEDVDIYFMAIWYTFWVSRYNFSRLGIFYQEKSGNPGSVSNENLLPSGYRYVSEEEISAFQASY
jgi:hypothetical protein